MPEDEPLASWKDTPTRQAITDFVVAVTSPDTDTFVEPDERVAVFDNDGTLWSEKPIPIQLDFTLFRMAEIGEHDRALRDRQPYKAAVERDYHWLGEVMIKHYRGDDTDMAVLIGAIQSAFDGMSVEDFSDEVPPVVRSPQSTRC